MEGEGGGGRGVESSFCIYVNEKQPNLWTVCDCALYAGVSVTKCKKVHVYPQSHCERTATTAVLPNKVRYGGASVPHKVQESARVPTKSL